jgi:hypothetical protein
MFEKLRLHTWQAARPEASHLQCPDGALKIVARGPKVDDPMV